MTPEEVTLSPQPTPMLDAALVRAEAVRVAALDTMTGPVPDGLVFPASGPDATAAGSGTPEVLADPEAPDVGEPDPIVHSAPEPSPEPVELPPLEVIGPDSAESNATPGAGPDVLPEDVATGDSEVEPDLHWRAALENLIELAEEEAGRGGGSAEVWAARRRVLDWVSEAEGKVDDATLWQTVMVMLAEPDPIADGAEQLPIPPDEPEGGVLPSDEEPALRVARLSFCKEVFGFGRIDPVDASSCRAGQDVIVYCEMEGVRYLEEADGQVARLSTSLEIVPASETTALWRDVRAFEDRCSRSRRDFYVGYGLTLPDSLKPGQYRLLVSQGDLQSGSQAVGELRFVIR